MSHALQFLVLATAGWLTRHQQDLIDYLREENRVLRDQLGSNSLRLTDEQRRRLAVRGKSLGRKALGEVAGIHSQPHGEWMKQMAQNLTDAFDGFLRNASHLIHDRDPLFTSAFGDILKSSGVQPIKLPPRSPNLNAYAERFVRSIEEECTNRLVVLGESHLRFIVHEYAEHYNRERNHQGLDNQLLRPLPPANPEAAVQRRERIGGLLTYYHREAA